MEKTSFTQQLNELHGELSLFKGDDILVHLSQKQCIKMGSGKYELTKELEKIISDAKKIEKEKGIFPLCKSKGVVCFFHQKKEVETPIFIIPLAVELNRIAKSATFKEVTDSIIINPFLIQKLSKEFPTLTLPANEDEFESFIPLLFELGFDQLDTEVEYIGNFHHHRIALMGELEQIIHKNDWSLPLLELFGEEIEQEKHTLAIPNETLFPFDQKQSEVFDQLKAGNCVLQGPPGTGKSQVICNVIGKLLHTQNKALVVSDKRVALEVIQQKLDAIGLGHQSVITTTNYSSKALLASLKKNWEFLENQIFKKENQVISFQQSMELLQDELSILNQPELLGGLSLGEFLTLNKQVIYDTTGYSSSYPNSKIWLENKNKLLKLPLELMHLLRHFKDIHQQMKTVHQLDKLLNQWLKDINQVENSFGVTTFGELKMVAEKARICHRFSTDYFKKFEHIILNNSKKFLATRKNYLKISQLVDQNHSIQEHWIKRPSPAELIYLENKALKKGLIHRITWKNELKKWLRTPDIDLISAIETLKKQYSLENELLTIKLCFAEMGVENLKIDLDMIASLIEALDQKEWDIFSKIKEDERTTYNKNYVNINNLLSELKINFTFSDDTTCSNYLNELRTGISTILIFSSILLDIPKNLIDCYQKTPDIDLLEKQIFQSTWITFRSKYPNISIQDPSNFLTRITDINNQFDQDTAVLVNAINLLQQKKFNSYHRLLQTPAYKLTNEEKEKKRQLKSGKSILVKEFAKTRSNKSIRELLSGDASHWIHLLKPIWLTNPSQLASNIPLEKNYFDLAIIDEASQLLLSHSVGCLYRAKRILVAGDSQQMAPSNYFNPKDENSLTLLHKASFYFKNILLNYHFRSEHPSLIAYSNQYFYNDGLIAFPSVSQEQMPIKFHFIENGRYINRANDKEAQQVADHLASILQHSNEKIGVVAFSESQLACIFEKLSPSLQIQLLNRIDQDTLFFKALEQIQGDECDRLIISFGYAKNEAGIFEMRFGPINEKNGGKRLNVLFSRARRNIDFFASVVAKDFAISSNNSVRLLWKWFLFIESEQAKSDKIKFPFKLAITQKGQQLSCENWANLSENACDVLTITRTLIARGWKLTVH